MDERDPVTGPASEQGDVKQGGEGIDTSRPASEADSPGLAEELDEADAPPVSWPGKGGPGTIPPPG